jgi:P-type E1-E2 ATPase
MRDREIPLGPGIEQDLRNRAVIGETPVLVAVNGKLAGGIFMADRPRPETPEAIRELKSLHYELAMLTGDETAVGLRIAEEVGLAPGDVKAELKPEDKVRLIQEMERTEKVAMVGDGINDAPALSGATVGIAMGMGGTDLATNAASIVLVKEDFRGIPVIMRQSRFIIRVIKENLVAATVIHVVAGALAVIGAITIVQSAFFHEASSVLVLMNTARLFSISRNGSSVRTGSVPAASA